MTTNKLKTFYKYVRFFLLFSILANIAVIIYFGLSTTPGDERAIQEDLSFRIQLIFVATVTFVATYLPSFIETKQIFRFPEFLQITIIIFILAAGYISQFFDLFVRFYWWDDVLHFTSGTFIAFAGFLLIYKLNHRYSFDLNPWLIAVFTFSFSIAVAVFWEIGEFLSDWFFQTNYQKWDVPPDTPLIGKSYQGLALRDSMADLIIASIGAILVSIYAFLAVSTKKEETLKEIRRLVEKKNEKSNKSD